jgi:hypothetical protein
MKKIIILIMLNALFLDAASFNFVNAYKMITDINGDGVVQNTEGWAEKEQESHVLLV